MKRVCTICARAGSQGVKSKNKRDLVGKPLFQHTVEQAQQSGLFDWIVLSSDDQDIIDLASELGLDQVVARPPELATSEAGKIPAITHAVEMAEKASGISFDTMVDMDVTSPLRNAQDISDAVALLEENSEATNVITGQPSHRSPYFNLVERGEADVVQLSKPLEKEVLRRQDAPVCFDMNASIYVWRRESFFPQPKVFDRHTLLHEMPHERSIDIDTEFDFQLVEFVMQNRIRTKG